MQPEERSGRIPFGLLLVVLAAAPFLRGLNSRFIWDDRDNYVHNERFRGPSAANLQWAVSTTLLGVYQPVGWLAMELQYPFFGLDPVGYRVVGLAVHAATAWLLFRFLFRWPAWPSLTGESRAGACFLGAALYAVNPQRVEPVNWLSCQQYLWASLFGMLAAHAYLNCLEAPTVAAWRRRLLPFALCFAAAVFSKPAAIALPAALAGMALHVLRPRGDWNLRRRAVELFIAALPAALLGWRTFAARYAADVVVPPPPGTWSERLAQAALALQHHATALVRPFGLSPFYPLTNSMHLGDPRAALAAGVALAALVAALICARKARGFAIGLVVWIALLSPTLGLVRSGEQAWADRYSLLPALVTAFLVVTLIAARPRLGMAAAVLLTATFAIASARYCRVFRTDVDLWRRAAAGPGKDDPYSLSHLGATLMESGALEESRKVLAAAAARFPRDADVLHAYGGVLVRYGDLAAGLAALQAASEVRPRDPDIAVNLGAALVTLDRFPEAVEQFERALRLSPRHQAARANLAQFWPRAAAEYEVKLLAAPDDADLAFKLGRLLLVCGERARGEAVLYELLRKHPDRTDVRELLGEAAKTK
ncbi:MAG TPA: hypothetical protein VNC50_01095 [Planctomycetia bacterium]|nr:hypothetical protein [Planctomycetia bacterium]